VLDHQNPTIGWYSLITPSVKISSKFIDNFFSYTARPNGETDWSENITSLAKVIIAMCSTRKTRSIS